VSLGEMLGVKIGMFNIFACGATGGGGGATGGGAATGVERAGGAGLVWVGMLKGFVWSANAGSQAIPTNNEIDTSRTLRMAEIKAVRRAIYISKGHNLQ
jgi:hypothetical protein